MDDNVKKSYVLLFALLALFLALAVACQTPTPTPPISPPPTPTNESPIPTPTPRDSPLPSPTPPVSPLQESEAADDDFSYWLTWDQGYVVCDSLGVSMTLKVAAKWVEPDTGAVVFSETLDTGEFAPVITGTGQFNDVFRPDYPALEDLKNDAGEWVKGWWSRIDGGNLHCYDEWGNVYAVPQADTRWFAGGVQDGEGYWFAREIDAPPAVISYCPLSLHGDVPTGITPTPTPTPEAGTGGDTGKVEDIGIGIAIVLFAVLTGAGICCLGKF